MDREVSLSRLIVEMIPACGATWGDLRRDIAGPSNEAIEFAIKGLIASGCVKRVVVADTGIFFRPEYAPGYRRPRLTLSKPVVNGPRKHCYACQQDLPPQRFGADRTRPDGKANICKGCCRIRRQRRKHVA